MHLRANICPYGWLDGPGVRRWEGGRQRGWADSVIRGSGLGCNAGHLSTGDCIPRSSPPRSAFLLYGLPRSAIKRRTCSARYYHLKKSGLDFFANEVSTPREQRLRSGCKPTQTCNQRRKPGCSFG